MDNKNSRLFPRTLYCILFSLFALTVGMEYNYCLGSINFSIKKTAEKEMQQPETIDPIINLAIRLREEKKYEESLLQCEKALKFGKESNNLEKLAFVYSLMGDLSLYHLHRADRAAGYHRQAYETYLDLLKSKRIGYPRMTTFIEQVALPAYTHVKTLSGLKLRNRKALRDYTDLNSKFTDFITDLAIVTHQELNVQKASSKKLFLEKMKLSGNLEQKELEALALEDSLYQTELELKEKALILLKEKGKRIEAEKQQAVLAQKAAEADEQKLFTWLVTVALVLSLSLVSLLAVNWKKTKKINTKLHVLNENINEEKDKSDKLLLNILPLDVAHELKRSGKVNPRNYELATVMFTDFKNFTNIAEKQSPEQTVHQLNRFFETFDEIISAHNLEKIKTIGDGYLCAGGLPVSNVSNPVDAVKAGLEMLQAMKRLQEEDGELKELNWELRVGIHTGPVVAGVIGKKKFAYDIWGDTVNLAARLEASGEAGKVNISGETYLLVKDVFRCEHRGKVKAKNKGEIDMYFVEAE